MNNITTVTGPHKPLVVVSNPAVAATYILSLSCASAVSSGQIVFARVRRSVISPTSFLVLTLVSFMELLQSLQCSRASCHFSGVCFVMVCAFYSSKLPEAMELIYNPDTSGV